MTRKLITIAASVPIVLSAAAANAADFSDMFSLRGFGTVAMVHSSEDEANFRGTVFQPDGAGYTRDWDLRSDTKLGGQLTVKFNDKLSAVVQVVSQYEYDRTFSPQIEWANIKFQATPELALRVGRVALPTFLISEARFVGYANPWVRPPQEVYFVSSITSNDGVDVTYSFKSGSVQNTVQALYGTSEADLPTGTIEADPSWGANYTAQFGSTTLRVGYIKQTVELMLPSTNGLFTGLTGLGNALNTFGFANAGATALALRTKYQLDDMDLTYLSLGGTYDPGDWFVTAEIVDFGGDGFLSDTRAGYVTAGYRIGKFTPYATLATVDPDIETETGIPTAGLPGGLAAGATALNAGINSSLNAFTGDQESASVGLRWDFQSNMALKVQYDRWELGENSAGRLGNAQPGFERGGNLDLFSVALDFIF